jgi:hypothetical protein
MQLTFLTRIFPVLTCLKVVRAQSGNFKIHSQSKPEKRSVAMQQDGEKIPFHEKDLDSDAEDYIVGSVDKFPLPKPLKLVIQMPTDQLTLAETHDLSAAIRNYFSYRVAEMRRRMRFQFREGCMALFMGLLFLLVVMSVRELIFAFGKGPVAQIFTERLLIVGWVAMWRPIQIFLYEWWPVRHHGRLYAKIAAMPVELRRTEENL